MIRTTTPGIYKRGSRYVVTYRVGGRQRKESARTLADARRIKAARQADAARGEFFEASKTPFVDYAAEWVQRYQGRGRHGFRSTTRDDYRRCLERYAYPFFDERLRRRLAEITPRDISNFVAWLCDESAHGRCLADATIRNIVNPVRSCLATAVQEGLIRHNPAVAVSLPHRPDPDRDDEPEVRAMTREQLAIFLAVVHPAHRLLFEMLASTGLRISEAVGLQWRHLRLNGSRPCVRVRRALVRGGVQPPKSRYGRRDVPLDGRLVEALRGVRMATGAQDDDLVFPSRAGTPIRPENVRRRVLRVAAEEAGAPWAGFHTFRHTCASLLFSRGANAVQVQRWLGHHSAAFTLQTYVHLMPDELGAPLDLKAELQAPTGRRESGVASLEPALLVTAMPSRQGVSAS
jgi:integrase